MVFFVELGIFVRTGPIAIDSSVARWFQTHRTNLEIDVATIINSATTPTIVAFGAVLLLLFRNYWNRSWHLDDFLPLAVVIFCGILSLLATLAFDRVRPGSDLAIFFDFYPSFPSNRTVFVAAVGSAFLFIFEERRWLSITAVLISTTVVSIADLALGNHWVTDIFGSILLTLGVVSVFNSFDLWLRDRERYSI